MSELEKFIKELEVETSVTEIFSQKLDILDFIKKNFSINEYQQCLASIAGTLENIIKSKDKETKLKIYQNLKNPINYTYNEEIYNITLHSKNNNDIIEKIYREYPKEDDMMRVIDNFNTEEMKSTYYLEFVSPYQSESIKEILFFGVSKIKNTSNDMMIEEISKIIIDIDHLDQYLNLLYIGYKYLISDNSILIDYYKFGDSTFLVFDVCIEKSKLLELAKSNNLEEDLEKKPYDGPAKKIKSYSRTDLRKICLDGAGIFKLFYEQSKEPITINLGFEFDDPLKYFKYNGKLYSLQVNSVLKRLFL